MYNPCITCGACCAYFRASFYWAESDLVTSDGVPHELTAQLQGHFLVMKGTDSRTPRCIALEGTIGSEVSCTIYPHRSSACRSFPPSWENGIINERCDKARGKWGLPPLEPSCWIRPQEATGISFPDPPLPPRLSTAPDVAQQSSNSAPGSNATDIPEDPFELPVPSGETSPPPM